MKRFFTLLIALILCTATVWGQVTVTNPGNTTPGLSLTYGSLALAIADLNLQTAISGPVTITLDAATPQTAPAGGYSITAIPTGASLTNNITFEGSGNTITAGVGVSTTNDAIIKLIGADFITIQNFNLVESGGNTTTTQQVEWGIALLYATTTNGAQNNIIKNNTITLNRTNINTFGIYSNSTHTNAAPTTAATATTTAGGNSGLKIYGNTISNVNMGIVVVGPTAAADANTGVDIGGSGGVQANTITNFGTSGTISSYANVSGTVNGILVRNCTGFNVSYNTITSSVGGTTVGTLNGIQIPAASAAPTVTFTSTINNNNISLQSGLIAGTINGISVPSGSASATSTMSINNNNFHTFGHTVSGTGAITFITNASTFQTLSISNNTFTNLNVNTTGSITFISHGYSVPATGTQTISNNSIVTAFNKTGAGGTITFATSASSSATGAVITHSGNNVSNITVTGATAITGWSNLDGGTPTKSFQNNTLNNWIGGTSTITGMSLGYCAAGSIITGNTITNITGQGTITGLILTTSSAYNVYSNTINNLSSTGTGGAVMGISITGGSNNVYQHTIHTLSSTAAASAVTGISVSGATLHNIYKNKIYNLSSATTGTTVAMVNGLTISSGTAVNFYNNLIGDLRAAASTSIDAVRGINITATTLSATYNIYYNTVYLSGVGGIGFGSSGIFHAANSTAGTAKLDLRNNIIINNCTPNGAGLAVAFRRSGTALNNYATSSNNNDFFAPTIMHDGTTDYDIAAYKILVGPTRDAASINENPNFLSLSGSNSGFLHIDPTVATQIESGAQAISGITDDFDGDSRNATTPDIGADEGAFTLLDLIPPTITYAALSNTSSLVNRTLAVTITDPSNVGSGANQPVLYWKINAAVTYTGPVSPTSIVGNIYNYSFGTGVIAGDVVSYFVVAQDAATSANVGSFPAGATVTNNPPLASAGPASPSTYTILGTICGTRTVGSGGYYATLTAAIADLNSKELCGSLTLTLLDANYSAGETFPLIIYANSGSSVTNTVTIKPTTSQTTTITGSSTSGIIVLYGADYIILDGSNSGGTDKNLTWENTNTTANAYVIGIFNNSGDPSSNCTIMNSQIKASSQITNTTYGIIMNALGGGYDNIIINNNDILSARIGLNIGGVSGNPSTNAQITNNMIGSTNASTAIQYRGMVLTYANNTLIEGNEIMGAPLGNTNYYQAGIYVSTGSTNTKIRKNNIHDWYYTGTSGYGNYGIYYGSDATTSTEISNNIIYSIKADGDPSLQNYAPAGIYIYSGGNCKIWYNSINMTGATLSSSYTSYSACLSVFSGITALDVRNNIFKNSMTPVSGTGNKTYAVYSASTNAAFTNINHNNYFIDGINPKVGYLSSDRTTLANWQSATTQDANSISGDPLFTSPTNMLPLSGSPVIGAGTAIAGITTDYAGTTRSLFTPTIGAYEVAASTNTTWAGTTGNNWTTSSNWDNGVPGSGTNVTIPSGLTNYPTIASAVACNNLVLENGATLLGNNFLTVNGTTTLNRDITGNAFHLMSIPVTSSTVGAPFLTGLHDNIWIRSYAEATGNWTNMLNTEALTVGQGYSIWMDIASATATFTGTLNNGNVSPTVTNSGTTGNINYDGWNLVGNPYPSAIKWNIGTWTKTNIDASVAAWSASAGNYVYWNGTSGSLADGVIPVAQGFFVKATGSPALTIPNDSRVHSNVGYYKNTPADLISLKASSTMNTFTDETFVNFNALATDAYDHQFDAIKLYGDANAPQLFTKLNGAEFAINVLPSSNQNQSIPVGFKAGVDGVYTLHASYIESLNSGMSVYLDDIMLGSRQNLRNNPVYSFHANATDDAMRFKLSFATVGIVDASLTQIRVWSAERSLYITNVTGLQGDVQIINTAGQLVYAGKLMGQSTQVYTLNLASATYMVRIITKEGVAVRKVFVK